MRATTLLLGAAGIMTVLAVPAFAMDSSMMSKGETVMVMPDGKMATMPMMDDKMSMAVMKMAKPMDKPMIMMMGSDGKMYMMEDATMPDGKMMSDDMMMAK
jgi:hypothetical protein